VLQGLASLLRDLVLAGTAPDRLELTSFSPQFRPQLPELARSIGKARLLLWQAQLKGSEQQLRHSVNPRLWLEVLLLGLLAEPQLQAAPAAAPAQPVAARAIPAPAQPVVAQTVATQAAQSGAVQSGVSAVAPAVQASPEATLAANAGARSETNLGELWQQILAGLELPSTRMLLSQQAQLVRLDERRAVVTVAGNWMAMVQSRLPLLEKAMASALGSPRQLVLEGGGEMPAQPPQPPKATVPAPASQARTAPAPLPTPTPSSSAPVSAPAQVPTPTPIASQGPASAVAIAPPQQEVVPQVKADPRDGGPPPMAAPLDEKAKRLADFFNGEVIEMDGPLDGKIDGPGNPAGLDAA
jgi:DNA polymerase-3 subunit gamma/tau